MDTESASNLPPTNPSINDDAGGDFGAESSVMMTSSSLTRGASLMAKGEIPELTDFFKRTTITEEELQAYHHHGWLTSNVLSSIPEVDVSTVHGSSILCFESHLLIGLGLPPSKLLAAIMNYLGCSLVHFNANAIAVLSSFMMLCECWLRIPPDSSLFWYYYLHPNMPNSSMAGSGYPCAATVGTSIFWHSSRVAGRIHRRNGSV
jgi:hypothetical protein